MNNGSQGSPGAIFAMIGGMVVALYVAASILLDEGNQLAGLFFYLLIGSGLLGLIAPRLSFMIFILQCGYLDLLKRLMVIGGSIGFSDLFWVLGIAPVTVCGIATGLMLRIMFGRQQAGDGDMRRLIFAVLLNAALGAYLYIRLKAGIGGTLRDVANGSAYALLLFITPVLFPTQESVAKCMRYIVWVFMPVAAYGIYQQIFGYQEFEIEYLKTGLSIEIKQLEANRIRAFGTLNSPTSLSVVGNSLAALIIATSFTRLKTGVMRFGPVIAGILVMIFLGAWVASTARAGLALLPVALVGGVLFQKARGVRMFYGTLVGTYVLIVVLSPFIYDHIFHWTDTLIQLGGGGEFATNMVNMNSYVDRLQGFMNILLNPQAYSLFGIGSWDERDNSMRGHDPISEALVTYGAVPLVIGLVIIAISMKRVHRIVLDIKDPNIKAIAAALLGNAVGNIAVSIINGNLLGTFPVNVFFWLPIGWTIALRQADLKLRANAAPEPSPEVVAAPIQPRPRVGRFRPVRSS